MPAWNAHALLDHAPIGIVRSTVGGVLLYANVAMAQLLEFNSPDAMLRENAILRYKHAADRAALIDQLRCAGSVQGQEVTLLTSTGAERIVLASLTLDGEIVLSMLVDITARKWAEAHLIAQVGWLTPTS
jgi:PAS domain-containing protein